MEGLILSGISILIFIIGLVYIVSNYKIQQSISMSYYVLPNKLKLAFLIFVWGFALPLGILVGEEYPILLIAISLIMIVGITPNFQEYDPIKGMHLFGAFGGIITAMVSIWLEFDLPMVVLIMLFSAGIIYKSVKNPIWWIEVLAFSIVWLVLFIKFVL